MGEAKPSKSRISPDAAGRKLKAEFEVGMPSSYASLFLRSDTPFITCCESASLF
jgi:hypothetical protein